LSSQTRVFFQTAPTRRLATVDIDQVSSLNAGHMTGAKRGAVNSGGQPAGSAPSLISPAIASIFGVRGDDRA